MRLEVFCKYASVVNGLVHIREVFQKKKEDIAFAKKKIRMTAKIVNWYKKNVTSFGHDPRRRLTNKIRYCLSTQVPPKFQGAREDAALIFKKFMERAEKVDDMQNRILGFPDMMAVIKKIVRTFIKGIEERRIQLNIFFDREFQTMKSFYEFKVKKMKKFKAKVN